MECIFILFLFLDKKKRVYKYSQEDIHSATLTSDGYMTRNKLKKKLSGKLSSTHIYIFNKIFYTFFFLIENDEIDGNIAIKKSSKSK